MVTMSRNRANRKYHPPATTPIRRAKPYSAKLQPVKPRASMPRPAMPRPSKERRALWQIRRDAQQAKIPAQPGSLAAHKVFGTVELLEKILVNLDMKTLLLSQRVNADFNTVITESSKCQKKLFFAPATRDEISSLNMVQDAGYYHPSCCHWPWSNSKIYNLWDTDHSLPLSYYRPEPGWGNIVLYNPLLLSQDSRDYEGYGTNCTSSLHLWQKNNRFKLGEIPEDPSWKRMLLFQPTSVDVELKIMPDFYSGGMSRAYPYAYDSGLGFAEFVVGAEEYAHGRATADYPKSPWSPSIIFSRGKKQCNAKLQVSGRPVRTEKVVELGLVAEEESHEENSDEMESDEKDSDWTFQNGMDLDA